MGPGIAGTRIYPEDQRRAIAGSNILDSPREARQIAFRDLANGLLPRADGPRYVSVFRFYLDDSRMGEVFAMGGYFGRLDQWESFEYEWAACLREAHIRAFHATDVYGHYGEFKDWDRKKEKHYVKRFAAIAEKQTDVAFGRALDEQAYNEVLRPVLEDLYWTPHGKFTPLMWCARTCLEGLMLRWGRFVPADAPVAVIFEQGDGVGEAIDYFRALQKRGAAWARCYTSFGDAPKAMLPLQAADLIVHESARAVQERMHPTGRPQRKVLQRLVKNQRLELKVWTRADLLVAATNVAARVPSYERRTPVVRARPQKSLFGRLRHWLRRLARRWRQF